MADGCSPSAIQAEGSRQYRLLEDQEWDVYYKVPEQANKREEKEAKSKEAQVNRLIASIQANVGVLISVLFPRLFRLMRRKSWFQNQENFWSWNAESEQLLLLESGIHGVECRI